MSEERDISRILEILDDDYARAILESTRRKHLSAKELSEECDMSVSTVSRRVNTLLEYDLLIERTHVDPDGHHYSEYEAQLDRVEVQLLESGFDVRIELREDAPDRFARLWNTMRNE
ncbi:ArsR family transcriptional regulator [Halorubrum sp. Atlit-8R]|uniref:Helix-turn-helix transcriptional regulator n=1 Tax=Halorubrum salinarum TaxID=2739057 RepID=A0A7D4C802_9EURY|nr:MULTISPECIES: winged helix-turn-helix domain-containing protein [Halorubrum]QKG94498.1 helix-turn-helix transcriptional regulator [Halorubrum salinarum]RLM76741.1 ArsR family transcriptional regulator [Halorubrum sp. Atlit-8R]TKX87661.1 ArsR family transcriptional regulator [Halorubrum sp. SS5]